MPTTRPSPTQQAQNFRNYQTLQWAKQVPPSPLEPHPFTVEVSSLKFILSPTPQIAPLSEIQQFRRVEERWHPGTRETALQTSLRLWRSLTDRALAAMRAFFCCEVLYEHEDGELGSESGYEGDVESDWEGSEEEEK